MEQASTSHGVMATDAVAVTPARCASVEETGKCKTKRKKADQYARNVAKRQRLLHAPYTNRAGQQKPAIESNFEVHPKW